MTLGFKVTAFIFFQCVLSDNLCVDWIAITEWTDRAVALVAQELSDVCIYLVRLAAICGFNLGEAFYSKLQRNKTKYNPSVVARGDRETYEQVRNSHRAMRCASLSISSWQQLQRTVCSAPGLVWTLGSIAVGALAVIGAQKMMLKPPRNIY